MMNSKSLDPLVDMHLRNLASEKAKLLVFIEMYDKNPEEKEEYDNVRGRNIQMSYDLQRFMLDRTDGNFNDHYNHLKRVFDSYLSTEKEKLRKEYFELKDSINILRYNC